MTATSFSSPVVTPLTRLDRCDGCGAAAKTRVVLSSGGELLFCDHHTRKHADALREQQADLHNAA